MKQLLVCMGYECKKFVQAQRGFLIAGACLLLQFLLCVFSKPDLSGFLTNVPLYYSYVQRYGGEYRRSTAEEIDAELEKQFKITGEAWQGDDVFSEEAGKFHDRKLAAEVKLPVLGKVKERYAALEPLQQFGAEFVYDLEFSVYAKKFQLDWVALIFVTVLAAAVFSGDYRCKMEQILIPSKMGKRRLRRGKAVAVILLSGFAAAVFYGIQAVYFTKQWHLGDLDAPMQSFSGFETSTLPLRMREAMLLAGVLKVLATMVYALLLSLFTEIFQNEILAVVAAAAVTGCGIFAGTQGGTPFFFLLTPLRGVKGLAAATPGLLFAEVAVLSAELVVLYFLVCGKKD